MHAATYSAFKQELSKISSGWEHAAELGGLGLLAAPSVGHLRGKEWSEKNKSKAEVAGLGILAAPTAYKVMKSGVNKLRGVAPSIMKHASVGLADGALGLFKKADVWNANTGAIQGAASLNRGVATVAAAKPKFDAKALANAYKNSGIKPGIQSAARMVSRR